VQNYLKGQRLGWIKALFSEGYCNARPDHVLFFQTRTGSHLPAIAAVAAIPTAAPATAAMTAPSTTAAASAAVTSATASTAFCLGTCFVHH
jgi:hypothetical protein